MKNKHKNPICYILWRDAAFSFNKEMPEREPLPQLTTGFIISAGKNFTNIASNIRYDKKTKKVSPVDGFIIPNEAIIEFKKLKFLS